MSFDFDSNSHLYMSKTVFGAGSRSFQAVDKAFRLFGVRGPAFPIKVFRSFSPAQQPLRLCGVDGTGFLPILAFSRHKKPLFELTTVLAMRKF
jgi:hypothetical protein